MNRRTHVISGLLVLVAIAVLYFFTQSSSEIAETAETAIPVVTLTTAAEHSGQASVSLVGTVRAFSEAAVTAERAGRVTSVLVRLGDTVFSGQVIATLENASEQASVLQAEGVYEAALATVAQNEVGIDQANTQLVGAENSAVATFKGAFGTANSVMLTTIDQFFSDPSGRVPGLKLDGNGQTLWLNNERVAFQAILTDWRNRSSAINTSSDLQAELTAAVLWMQRTVGLVDVFLDLLSDQSGGRYTDAELEDFVLEFTSARSSLINTQTKLESAITSIDDANDTIAKASLAATGSQHSVADAQVKQALGSLRAAQANLAKTILRSPIAGTVNTLSVRTGDFVGGQQQIAEVANNDALEVVTAIGEQERDLFAVGDTVELEGGIAGVVTEIAPAIDASTGKLEVRIAAESSDLQNGDTVTLVRSATTTSADARVFVPLSAVKFEQTNGSVFIVTDGALEARPVELGLVRGGSVEVTSGLSGTERFVTDARGLQAGLAVEVTN